MHIYDAFDELSQKRVNIMLMYFLFVESCVKLNNFYNDMEIIVKHITNPQWKSTH
jgi:hypothetical protein